MNSIGVIVLNGPSSSGKSTLARALHQALPGYWLRWSLDEYLTAVEPPRFKQAPEEVPPEVPRRMFTGFHQAVGAIACAENRLILDHVILKPEWWRELREAVGDSRLFTVAVTCPLPELERRERVRGDREIGLARSQVPLVHAHGPHDLVLDTSASPLDMCVDRVCAALRMP